MTTDHQLAERYLAMLNQHDPDAVDGFVAAGYVNHNPFVGGSTPSLAGQSSRMAMGPAAERWVS